MATKGTALTEAAILSYAPSPTGRVVKSDAAVGGLQHIVHPTGSRTWSLAYRVKGDSKLRRIEIGKCSVVKEKIEGKKRPKATLYGMTLAEARERAATFKALARDGKDPKNVLREERAQQEAERQEQERKEAESRKTVRWAFERFMKLHHEKESKPRTAREVRRQFDHDVLPLWGDRTIKSITKPDVVELLDSLKERDALTLANRVRANLRKFMDFCEERGYIDHNPVALTKGPGKERKRERSLDEEEIRSVWSACETIGWPFGPLVKLLLLTGQRRGEIAEASWREIDVEAREWRIPAERSKNGEEHRVPLSDLALEILNDLPRVNGSALIFSTDGKRAVSGFSKAKRRIDELSGVSDWTFHAARHSVATGMEKAGILPHVVGAVLNHSPARFRGVTAVYTHYDYSKEKRQALDLWAETLRDIVSPSEKVTPIRRRSRARASD